MIRLILIGAYAIIVARSEGQVEAIPWSFLIAKSKKSIVPVQTQDTSWAPTKVVQGTAVLIGDMDSPRPIFLALTCAHVVAASFDTNDIPTRPASNVTLVLSSTSGPDVWMPAKVIHFDALNDLALCRAAPELLPKGVWERMSPYVLVIPPDRWRGVAELKEGITVLYCGFPNVGEGIGARCYPLSRTGMISQIVPGQRWFLMDGFVQEGHSGSPVFEPYWDIHNPQAWGVNLVGIARSYPDEFKKVYRKVGFVPSDTLFAKMNPGFTNVAPLDSVFPVLERMGLKRRK
jgi:hypothetical protein